MYYYHYGKYKLFLIILSLNKSEDEDLFSVCCKIEAFFTHSIKKKKNAAAKKRQKHCLLQISAS